MMERWTVWEDPCNMALVLSDGAGRKAWFAFSDMAKIGPAPPSTRYSILPFAGLLWAISAGLRPYKTIGEIKGLPTPLLAIGHEA